MFGKPLPTNLALFPDAYGNHMDKAAVIEALEKTVVLYCDSIENDNGGKLFGRHSFRVTGAQRLAALGVEVIKIMVSARWSGETVLRYVKDAPLENLPS